MHNKISFNFKNKYGFGFSGNILKSNGDTVLNDNISIEFKF